MNTEIFFSSSLLPVYILTKDHPRKGVVLYVKSRSSPGIEHFSALSFSLKMRKAGRYVQVIDKSLKRSSYDYKEDYQLGSPEHFSSTYIVE